MTVSHSYQFVFMPTFLLQVTGVLVGRQPRVGLLTPSDNEQDCFSLPTATGHIGQLST